MMNENLESSEGLNEIRKTKFYPEATMKFIVEEKSYSGNEFYFSYETDEFPIKELGNPNKRILIKESMLTKFYTLFEDKNHTFFFVEGKREFLVVSKIDNQFLTTDRKEEIRIFLNNSLYEIYQKTDYLDKNYYLPCYQQLN